MPLWMEHRSGFCGGFAKPISRAEQKVYGTEKRKPAANSWLAAGFSALKIIKPTYCSAATRLLLVRSPLVALRPRTLILTCRRPN